MMKTKTPSMITAAGWPRGGSRRRVRAGMAGWGARGLDGPLCWIGPPGGGTTPPLRDLNER